MDGTLFSDVVHKVATIGDHIVEYVEGNHHITVNGALVAAEDVVTLAQALGELVPLVAAAAAA